MRMKMLNSFKNDFILDKNRAHDIERRIDEKYCIASDTKMKEIILDKIMSRKEMFFYEKDYNRVNFNKYKIWQTKVKRY